MSQLDEFLGAGRILHLATVGVDGSPHVVPVWYSYRDRTIRIGTNSRTVKAKNVMRGSAVAFCVDKGVRQPLYGIMGRGTSHVVFDPPLVRQLALEILAKYFEDTGCESAVQLLEDTDCIIQIQVTSLADWC